MKKVLAIFILALLLALLLVAPFVAAVATNGAAAEADPVTWKGFFSTLLYALLSAAVPVLTWGGAQLIQAIRKKVWGDKYGLDLQRGVSAAVDAIYTAVAQTNQTYVDALKGKNIFDEAAQKEAFTKTWDTAQLLITDAAANAVVTLYGDFNTWLTAKIEEITRMTKIAKNTASVTPTPAAEAVEG